MTEELNVKLMNKMLPIDIKKMIMEMCYRYYFRNNICKQINTLHIRDYIDKMPGDVKTQQPIDPRTYDFGNIIGDPTDINIFNIYEKIDKKIGEMKENREVVELNEFWINVYSDRFILNNNGWARRSLIFKWWINYDIRCRYDNWKWNNK